MSHADLMLNWRKRFQAPRLRILFTLQTLEDSAGGSLYVRDLMLELARLGHRPVAFSTRLGALAQQMRDLTLPVVDRLEKLTAKPDIIHGNTPIETMAALLHFEDTPAIFTCHGWSSPDAAPPRMRRIMRHLAVDDACYERLVCQEGIPEQRVELHFNPVDLSRFLPRGPLPDRPRNGLVFSNYVTEKNFLPAVRWACDQAGIRLDVVGSSFGTHASEPERILPNYDIVFAKGRSALEALAVGNAVILCHTTGAGPMVASADLDRLRNLSFGWSAISNPVDPNLLLSEIGKYDAQDAALVSARIRESAGLCSSATTFLDIYQVAIEEFRKTKRRNPEQELHECAGFFQDVAPFWNTFFLSEQSRLLLQQSRRNELLADALATVPLSECDRSKIRIEGALGPATLSVGESANVTVQLDNASSCCVASYPPHPIHASYHWFGEDSGDARVFEGYRTEIFPPLLSGHSYRYNVKIQAPDAPGRYRLRLTLVQERVAWFDTGDAPSFYDLPILVKN